MGELWWTNGFHQILSLSFFKWEKAECCEYQTRNMFLTLTMMSFPSSPLGLVSHRAWLVYMLNPQSWGLQGIFETWNPFISVPGRLHLSHILLSLQVLSLAMCSVLSFHFYSQRALLFLRDSLKMFKLFSLLNCLCQILITEHFHNIHVVVCLE